MTTLECNVCQSPLDLKIYDSGDSLSLTSLCTAHPGKTEVYVCINCTHTQSVAIHEIAQFYDTNYDILVDSEEEDQVYEASEGTVVYRTEHQIRVMLEKLELTPGTRILDYGCAKSGTMRILSARQPDLDIFLFDVSERYRPFWEKFLPPQKTATYSIPPEWRARFDLVTSFFSLEHIDRPSESISDIYHLLKEDGILYGIVPNFEANIADLIVVDHVNHFTHQSLSFILSTHGFEIISISETAHKCAFVFIARKSKDRKQRALMPINLVESGINSACQIGTFWQKVGRGIRDFEKNLPPESIVALYGAGFHGALIASWLSNSEKIRYVIDQNAFLQGRMINGSPVISPNEVPSDVNTIMVGLNPNHAKQIIEGIASFRDRNFQYFYLGDQC